MFSVKIKNYMTLFTTLFLLMAGCSFEQNVKLDARLSIPPAVKQMPQHIGVYYSPEFIEFKKKIELGCLRNGKWEKTSFFFTFPVGTASRDLFNQCLSSMFTSVETIPAPHLRSNQAFSIDGWLEPKIESFNWEMNCTNDYFSAGSFTATIVYLIKIYDSDGHLVTSIKAMGTSTAKSPKPCFKDCRDSPTEQAIQDAMAKFLIDFYDRAEIQQWLSNHVTVPGELK